MFAKWRDTHKSFSQKLLWRIGPLLLLILVAVQFFSYAILRRNLDREIAGKLDLMSEQYVMMVSNIFRQHANDLETLLDTPLIQDYHSTLEYHLSEEAEIHRRQLQKYFANFYERAGSYSRIRYFDAGGRLVCSVGPAGASPLAVQVPGALRAAGAQNAALAPPIVAEALRFPREIQRGDFLKGTAPQARVLRYAKAAVDPLGRVQGVLVLDGSAEALERQLRTVYIGAAGGVYMKRLTNGEVLGEPRLHQLGLQIEKAVPGTSWEIVLAADKNEFAAPVRHIQSVVAMMCLASVLILLYVMRQGIKSVMGPLRDLLDGIRRISRGDLDSTIRVQGEDEIAAVSTAFNEMAKNLKRNKQSLQDKIDQLTALQTLSEAVISRQDKDKILSVCLEAVVQGLHFDRGSLYWIDWKNKRLAGSAVFGMAGVSGEMMRQRAINLESRDILAHVVRRNEPVYIADPQSDPRCNPDFVRETGTRAFCAVPIHGKQKVLGVIAVDNFYSHKPILEEEIESLLVFANAAGIALENMELLNEVHQSEIRRRMILNSTLDAILSLDRDFNVTSWNRGAELLFKYSASEAVGRPVTGLFDLAAAESVGELFNQVQRQACVNNFAIPGITKDGKSVALSLSWSAGPEEATGGLREWSVVIRDVTEQKQLQGQLIRAEKLSAVGQLISGIAHEISNPLATVVGYSQMALLGRPPARIREDLLWIKESADRCKKIIDNLLLFVRQDTTPRDAVCVQEALQNVQRLLQYRLVKKENIQVVLDFDSRVKPVLGNLQQLEQVFLNIFNNACDAMASTPGRKRIHIKLRERDHRLRVEIADNGPGIPAELVQRIFDPVFTTKAPGKGTGLGLSIAQQIVHDHGGAIVCRSAPGEGAVFAIELPVADARCRPVPARSAPFPACPGKRILIVDDEPSLARMIAQLMRQDRDKADLALTGQAALRFMSRHPYDLIITDIALGEVSGSRIVEYWHERLRRKGTKILMITGDILEQPPADLMQKFQVQCVMKPFDLNDLLQKARELLLSTPPSRST
ncbi:MAG: PAS domain S-box protein [Elusimicrobia bacterium]|nr:PAS domain S-box protein [Elusimicrobiota bacterium]